MPDIYISSVIRAPANDVWALIRNFNDLPVWHPLVKHSRIEEGRVPDQVGCVRDFELIDGGRIRERLLALSDYDYSCTYAILDSPMGVRNYVATLKLTPVTEHQQTFAEWSAEFDCDPQAEDELIRNISQDVFAAGFDALDIRLSSAS